MIIAAHAGTGKTRFAKTVYDSVDFVCMPYKFPYILCYPERNAKDEYERRYKERGNTTDFLNVFIGYWDIFLDQMEAYQESIIL